MLLKVAIVAGSDIQPTDQPAIDAANEAAARQASAWTQPVFSHETDGAELTALELPVDARVLYYTVDAQPKADPSIITTSNVAHILLPPRT